MKVDSYTLARMLGISQATVSRAFSRPEKVSEATRERIMEAAKIVGYTPNKNASALRRKGSGTIILLYIKRNESSYWTNERRNFWIFSEAVLSLTRVFQKLAYHLEIRQVESVSFIKPSQIKDHCDGLIVFDYVSKEEAEVISGWQIPYVLCHRTMHLSDYNHSATDNYGGGRLQGEYLRSRGALQPLYVMNDEDPFSHSLRRKGFIDLFPTARIIDTRDAETMRSQLVELIEEAAFDGIAFVNDLLMVRMLTVLRSSGIDLERRFPIIGYDNSTLLTVLDHTPASIEIGIADIYTQAATALMELIAGKREAISLVHEPQLA